MLNKDRSSLTDIRSAIATETVSRCYFGSAIGTEAFGGRSLCRWSEACTAILAEVGSFGVVGSAIRAAVGDFFGFATGTFFLLGTFAGYLFFACSFQAFLCSLPVGGKLIEFSLYLRIAFASIGFIYLPTETGIGLLFFTGKLFQFTLCIEYFHIRIVLRHKVRQSFHYSVYDV